ncbi:GNAT family N-acetyltransferase [Micromonospora chalcea]
MAVDEQWRGNGLGRRLVDAAESRANELNAFAWR